MTNVIFWGWRQTGLGKNITATDGIASESRMIWSAYGSFSTADGNKATTPATTTEVHQKHKYYTTALFLFDLYDIIFRSIFCGWDWEILSMDFKRWMASRIVRIFRTQGPSTSFGGRGSDWGLACMGGYDQSTIFLLGFFRCRDIRLHPIKRFFSPTHSLAGSEVEYQCSVFV